MGQWSPLLDKTGPDSPNPAEEFPNGMSRDSLPADPAVRSPHAPAPALQRAEGRAEVRFSDLAGRTRLARLYQEGQAKIRLPRPHGDPRPVAVLINTAGGVTGGDRLAYGAAWGPGAAATVTSQAAERIYRSSGATGRVATRLEIGAGADAEWLPQETILFDRSRLERRLDIDLAPDARLLMAETIVFGRTAMGETVHSCFFADHWRLRRGGRLVFAESLRIDGDPKAILAGPATGGGALAVSTVLLAAPDATEALDRTRALLEDAGSEAGASAFDGLLVVRLVSPDAQRLRADVVRLLEGMRGRPLPRVWSC